jgi:hypothetical protein
VAAAARHAAALAAIAAVALTGCAGRRVEHGIFHAPARYRVAVPGGDWEVVDDSRADLELRHRTARAGIVVNALCETPAVRRSYDVLTRHLLVGLRDRAVLERGQAPLDGRLAAHRVLEGRVAAGAERVRVESYVMKDERCVYDLLYVAPPEAFDAWRGDFQRVVDSFAVD